MVSPSGQELLGVITSHGPFRESYRSSRKSSGTAAANAVSTAEARLSAERVRAALPSPASGPTLLQQRVPGSGAKVVTMEGPTTIPENGGGAREAQGSKPALSRTGQKQENARARSS
jgi:hypothetical protein